MLSCLYAKNSTKRAQQRLCVFRVQGVTYEGRGTAMAEGIERGWKLLQTSFDTDPRSYSSIQEKAILVRIILLFTDGVPKDLSQDQIQKMASRMIDGTFSGNLNNRNPVSHSAFPYPVRFYTVSVLTQETQSVNTWLQTFAHDPTPNNINNDDQWSIGLKTFRGLGKIEGDIRGDICFTLPPTRSPTIGPTTKPTRTPTRSPTKPPTKSPTTYAITIFVCHDS